jgi:thioredoxin-related protein
MDLHDEWKNKVKVLAVSIDDARSVAKVKSLVKGKKWPYQVLLDSNKKLYKALNLTSIPFIMIVSDGKVIWSHVGYMPGDEELVVKKALEEWTQHFNKK